MLQFPQFCVSPSGFSAEEKRHLAQAAQQLGIEFDSDLSDACTHLVSNTVRSAKYRIAVDKQLPVVRKEWLLDSRAQGKLVDEDAYLLLPLHELAIAVSGASFGAREREHVETIVAEQGGRLHRDLAPGCTHLVVDAARGEKYTLCRQRPQFSDVSIVSCEWLYECLRCGVYLDEASFQAPQQSEPCLSSCVLHTWQNSASEPLQLQIAAASRALGATRTERFSTLVTHVLLGDHEFESHTLLSELEQLPGVVVVRAEWLLECHRRAVRISTNEFRWSASENREDAPRLGGLRRTGSGSGSGEANFLGRRMKGAHQLALEGSSEGGRNRALELGGGLHGTEVTRAGSRDGDGGGPGAKRHTVSGLASEREGRSSAREGGRDAGRSHSRREGGREGRDGGREGGRWAGAKAAAAAQGQIGVEGSVQRGGG